MGRVVSLLSRIGAGWFSIVRFGMTIALCAFCLQVSILAWASRGCGVLLRGLSHIRDIF
jgi:hypothetical protein